MLYHLLYPLRDAFSGFNVIRYITFRSAGAVLTALIVSFLLGPSMIAWLRRLKVGQQVRNDGKDLAVRFHVPEHRLDFIGFESNIRERPRVTVQDCHGNHRSSPNFVTNPENRRLRSS